MDGGTGGCTPRAFKDLGEIRGLIFLRGRFPWFHGAQLSDTSQGTMGSIERWQDSGGSRCRRSCHSKNRGHAGRCSASVPTGFASVRLVIFSDATRATAGSTRGITYGLRITRDRCRTLCKIKRNRLHGRSARSWCPRTWHACWSHAHRADAERMILSIVVVDPLRACYSWMRKRT
jgi:hypothetical protein